MNALIALSGLTCATVAILLAAIWRRRGWGDVAAGAEAFRKLQRAPVPAVGGLAIAATWGGLLVASPAAREELGLLLGERADSPVGLVALVAAALLALLGGVLDDVRPKGLGPLTKAALQALAGAALALPVFFPDGFGAAVFLGSAAWMEAALWAAGGLVALNAINTFDNADGASSAMAGCGLLVGAPILAGAPLGFLLPNLFVRRGSRAGRVEEDGPRDPLAYLGDGGSQLLGLALLVVPGAWPALLVPALDLARVAVLRVRKGSPPWRGDRRHLAHRLQRAGLAPVLVVAILIGIALPVFLWPGFEGVLVTCSAFLLAWGTSPACD